MTIEIYFFDIPTENLADFHNAAAKMNLPTRVMTMRGPAGGNPVVHVYGTTKEMFRFARKHYMAEYNHADLAMHLVKKG